MSGPGQNGGGCLFLLIAGPLLILLLVLFANTYPGTP